MQDVKMQDKFCVQVASTYSVKRVISRVDTLYISMSCVFSSPVLHENQCLRKRSHYVKRDTRPDCRGYRDYATQRPCTMLERAAMRHQLTVKSNYDRQLQLLSGIMEAGLRCHARWQASLLLASIAPRRCGFESRRLIIIVDPERLPRTSL